MCLSTLFLFLRRAANCSQKGPTSVSDSDSGKPNRSADLVGGITSMGFERLGNEFKSLVGVHSALVSNGLLDFTVGSEREFFLIFFLELLVFVGE